MFFTDIRIANRTNPTHLEYDRAEIPLSQAALDLKVAIDAAARRIAFAFPNNDDRQLLFEQLVRLASRWLIKEKENHEEGMREFDGFKSLVVDKAIALRTAYFKKVLMKVLIALLSGLILIGLWISLIQNLEAIYAQSVFSELDTLATVNALGSAGFTFVGIALGVSLAEFLANLNLSYENFDRISRYQMPFGWYVVYVITLAAVLLVVLYLDIIRVGVRDILLNDLASNPKLGVIAGLLCGLSEPHVASLLTGALKGKEQKGEA